MIEKKIVEKILSYAVMAPSGENCQPWKFQVDCKKNELYIYNIPSRDQSLYSWGQRASIVSHGALLENINIAAKNFGYSTTIQLYPNQDNEKCIARIILLEENNLEKDALFEYIDKRCTNRKPYSNYQLTDNQKRTLHACNNHFEHIDIHFIEDKRRINTLARAAASNEVILFTNKKMHNFFFSHINWTKEEDRKNCIGFYTKTLELDDNQVKGFRLFSRWKVLRVLSSLGIARVIAKQNSKIYNAASAYIAFVIPTYEKSNFIALGRVLQRFWLEVTRFELNAQPLSGTLFLNLNVTHNIQEDFTRKQIRMISNAVGTMENLFRIQNGHLAFMLRVGKSDPPSARSFRLTPEIHYKD